MKWTNTENRIPKRKKNSDLSKYVFIFANGHAGTGRYDYRRGVWVYKTTHSIEVDNNDVTHWAKIRKPKS